MRAPHRGFQRWALALLPLLLAACGSGPEPDRPRPAATIDYRPASFTDLPGWSQDPVVEAAPALRASCRKLLAQPDERAVGRGEPRGTVGDWRPGCSAVLAAADEPALRRALAAYFEPMAVSVGGDPQGFFTGYYEIEFEASPRPSARYRYPLYRRPPDLVVQGGQVFKASAGGMQPYPSRGEIDDGLLSGRGLEFLWAADPVDLFFLHVQGSGVAHLPDGSRQRVGVAATNGRTFYPVGRALIDAGITPPGGVTAQSVRQWMRDHPAEAATFMRRNDRYVFFQPVSGAGPVGAQGVALTPMRSLAVDPDHIPLGAPMWLDTTWPGSDVPLRRLVVAQDVGGAIKGGVRGDFFWGTGESALDFAGGMKQRGRYWVFLPRPLAESLAARS